MTRRETMFNAAMVVIAGFLIVTSGAIVSYLAGDHMKKVAQANYREW